ncbi:hypothetical protein BD408DRAFT_408961 [Parasitella parasitica]|nr:hypothetical protein BD408DRAFT_408961 [Parasitella parasitica]
MLLIQPLKIDEINIVINDLDEDEAEQSNQQPTQFSAQLPPQPQISLSLPQPSHNTSLPSPIDFIDDDELLAILGLPVSASSSTTSTTVNSPVNELSLLDWEDMPELSEGEEDYPSVEPLQLSTNKRKLEEDIFAQYDFEETNPYTKKLCKQSLSQNPCIQPC